jgi:hypothetical protein
MNHTETPTADEHTGLVEITVFSLSALPKGLPLTACLDVWVTEDIEVAKAHMEANPRRHYSSLLKVLRMPNGDLEWPGKPPTIYGNNPMVLREKK